LVDPADDIAEDSLRVVVEFLLDLGSGGFFLKERRGEDVVEAGKMEKAVDGISE
jgi:hypothetical protein